MPFTPDFIIYCLCYTDFIMSREPKGRMALLPVVPALLWLFGAAGCNGDNGHEQDARSEDAAPDDAADLLQDEIQDLQPEDSQPEDLQIEDLQPDPDAVVDPVEEDALEEDVPSDAEDAPVEGETPCERSGGYCWRYYITFPACVTCPDRDGMTYLPAPQVDRERGCTVEGTGTGPWCCIPDWGSGTSTCEEAGGACYPDEGDYVCPVGWDATLVECDEASTVCCLPNSFC
jgi:hypothetical protein